jgi:hypothetical protein
MRIGGPVAADRRGGGARSNCVLFGIIYQLLLFVVDLVLVRTRSDAKLRAEVLVLRRQLGVSRQQVHRLLRSGLRF